MHGERMVRERTVAACSTRALELAAAAAAPPPLLSSPHRTHPGICTTTLHRGSSSRLRVWMASGDRLQGGQAAGQAPISHSHAKAASRRSISGNSRQRRRALCSGAAAAVCRVQAHGCAPEDGVPCAVGGKVDKRPKGEACAAVVHPTHDGAQVRKLSLLYQVAHCGRGGGEDRACGGDKGTSAAAAKGGRAGACSARRADGRAAGLRSEARAGSGAHLRPRARAGRSGAWRFARRRSAACGAGRWS